ncbi:MAG: phosphatidylinositol-specific phospholipase C domain-containing protein [Nitrospirota bacterium]
MALQQPSQLVSPLMIAHRGASGYAPENTLAAFRKAVELGCQMIELDVRLSRDQAPVVLHDHTLTRTAGDPRRVEELTVAELQQLDAGGWFAPEFAGERIPTLADALNAVPESIVVNVEIKTGPGQLQMMAERIWAIIHELKAEERVLCSSFTHKALWALRRLALKLPLAYLVEGRVQTEHFTEAKALQTRALILQAQWTKPALVRQAHAYHLQVFPYTVNRPLQMRQLLRCGVDGLLTNYPDRLARAISQHQQAEAQERRHLRA